MLIIKIYNISYLTYNQPQAKKVRIAGDPIGLYEHISNCNELCLNTYSSITLEFNDVFGTHKLNVHKYRVELLSNDIFSYLFSFFRAILCQRLVILYGYYRGVNGGWAEWAIVHPVLGKIEGAARKRRRAALSFAHPVLGSY